MSEDQVRDEVVLPAWQLRSLADAAKLYAGTTPDEAKQTYAKGVEDALRLILGQTDTVPVLSPLRPIYNLYLDSV
jgi:hypothetical protein